MIALQAEAAWGGSVAVLAAASNMNVASRSRHGLRLANISGCVAERRCIIVLCSNCFYSSRRATNFNPPQQNAARRNQFQPAAT